MANSPDSDRQSPAISATGVDGRIAAQVIAGTVDHGRYVRVTLPPEFATRAVVELLRWFKNPGRVVESPDPSVPVTFGAHEWCVVIDLHHDHPKVFSKRVGVRSGNLWFLVADRFTLNISRVHLGYLLRCLETVKPIQLTADGLPYPWVPIEFKSQTLVKSDLDSEVDYSIESDSATQSGASETASLTTDDNGDLSPGPHAISNETIKEEFNRICHAVGLSPAPSLRLIRGTENRNGFTRGHVRYTAHFEIILVRLVTCPNSDLAEILATAIHELAHPLSRSVGHELPFKQTLVQLASQVWGQQCFVEAALRVSQPYRGLDLWITAGIRAALKEAPPPTPKSIEGDQAARILSRIQKLRDLGEDQLGLPEGISATAAANDLIVIYGLEDYTVKIDDRIRNRLLDHWVKLDDASGWRAVLAAGVAAFFDVFVLNMRGIRRLHCFGRYSDIVTFEYLFHVSAGRIDREAQEYIRKWRTQNQPKPGETTRQRNSFCEAAAVAFREKLDRIKLAESREQSRRGAGRDSPYQVAKEFARLEHEKRGSGWRSSSRQALRRNSDGERLGQSMEIVRGVSSSGGAQHLLG